jgi:hypothetical protein
MEVAKLLASDANIQGTYSCQGEVDPKFLEKVSKKSEPPTWLADARDANGHPDSADIEVLVHQISELFAGPSAGLRSNRIAFELMC